MQTESLLLLSASQITLYRECMRKWAWRYLARLIAPQHPAAALGQEVDDTQLQPYLRDDRPIDFTRPSGYIAASGLAYLPKPKTNKLEVQKHFTIPSPNWKEHAFGFQGYMDLWLPEGAPGLFPVCTVHEDCRENRELAEACASQHIYPTVIDFKTTGDLKWAKAESQLAVDVQAQLYAFAAMYLTGKRTVDLSWVYFQTRGAHKAKRTHLRVTSDHVAEQFGKINETGIEMVGVRRANPDPLDLPPNPEMCEAYGGCPYRDRCNLSPAQVIEAMRLKTERTENMSNAPQPTSNLLAQMRAKKAGAQPVQGQAQSPVSNQTPIGQVPAPLPSSPPSLEEHVAANPQAAWMTAPADPRYAIVGQRPNGGPIYAYELAGQPAPINPPESTLPPAPATGIAAPAPVEAPKPKRGRPKATPAPVEDPADATLQNEPAPAPERATIANRPSLLELASAVDVLVRFARSCT